MNLADHDPFMRTVSGRAVSLAEPDEHSIDPRDIAEALAKQCRFVGQLPAFYSVAQHSVLVADLVPHEAKPYALLHDAHEAYIGDIPTPVKDVLRAQGAGGVMVALAARLDRAIFARFRLAWPMPADIARHVHHADLVALATERRDLLADGPKWARALPPATQRRIIPLPWSRAAELFLRRFRDLFPGAE